MNEAERERIRNAAKALRGAETNVRLLRSLAWPARAKEQFFAHGAQELPEVSYPGFDASPVHEALREARRFIRSGSPVEDWLSRCADSIGSAADLLASTATPEFLVHGERLFGTPSESRDGASALELARTVDALCEELGSLDLGAPPAACHLADTVADRIREACVEGFGNAAPEVVVSETLSANALAGPRRIQVRRGASFSDRDVEQLIEHEAFVHVCTSLNGRAQEDLPILAASHAGTTRTQEGLAVFAEFVSGSLEPDRLRRLADRVLAVQMSIEGADFLEIYRYFLEVGNSEEQSYESARRVFRGGVLTGGAPFTKDAVYLDGLLRVTNFLMSLSAEGRQDCMLLLFCGKLDLEDVPALAQLAEAGLCRPPRFLPRWARDRRFLVTFLAYSAFLNRVQLDQHRQHYRHLLAEAPRLHEFGRNANGSRSNEGEVLAHRSAEA